MDCCRQVELHMVEQRCTQAVEQARQHMSRQQVAGKSAIESTKAELAAAAKRMHVADTRDQRTEWCDTTFAM